MLRQDCMKAWIVESHGAADQLQYKQVADPQLTAGSCLIKPIAVSLNHLDVWVRKGVKGHQFPLPLIPGCDIAGEILELGSKSDRLKKGDRVLVNPTLSCGQCDHCLNHQQPLCTKFGIVGETQNGGLAEKVVVPIENCALIPQGIDPIEMASLPIAYVTAWNMIQKSRLKKGDWILIQAAGSGVSVAAIQMAKMIGAHIIVTSGDDKKLEKAKKIGAEFTVNYQKEDFRKSVKEILKSHSKRGCDVVIDHVGEKTFSESFKCLDWGGRLLTCGATTGSEVKIDLKPLFFKSLSIIGSTMGGDLIFKEVMDLVQTGKVKPVIDTVLPFSEANKGFELLENRSTFGKVVIQF